VLFNADNDIVFDERPIEFAGNFKRYEGIVLWVLRNPDLSADVRLVAQMEAYAPKAARQVSSTSKAAWDIVEEMHLSACH